MQWNSSGTMQFPKGLCHHGAAFNVSAYLEEPAGATELQKVNPHPNSQEGNPEECAKHLII